MHIVLVSILVKDDRIEDFLAATSLNVQATLKEPGVTRFDLLRERAGPNRFMLFEVYRQAEDHSRHKESLHYKRWAAEVDPWMAAPRTRTIFESCLPLESGWE